jgi:PAS domain S-box-containing protein
MSVDAIEGKSCGDLFPDFAEEYYRDDLEVIGSGKPKLGIIESLTTASGKRLWVRVDKLPLFDESGTVNGVLLFMTDLTEQRQAEQSIAESSAFLATMIDTLPIPIFYKDNEGKYLGCNPLFEKYIGIGRDDIIGKTVYDIFPKDLADVYKAADQEVFDNPVPQKYETRIRFADDSRHEIIFYKAPFYRHDGSVGGLIGAFHDITDQKMAHDALQTANRKLNLLSSITRHDIRNQLMALYAYIQLCGEDADKPEAVKDFVAKEKKIADAIARQIDFTKDYEDIGVRSAVWQDIAPLIRKSEASLPLGTIKLNTDCEGNEIFADPLLEKVFYNLIDNSLHYGGEKMTSIHVTEERSEKGLRIIYEDDGEGISDSDKKQLFTKGFGKHTGLGLFLSREILSITGITITESGKLGEGARFEIMVPEGGWRTAAGE